MTMPIRVLAAGLLSVAQTASPFRFPWLHRNHPLLGETFCQDGLVERELVDVSLA